jgi:hypothetical protein
LLPREVISLGSGRGLAVPSPDDYDKGRPTNRRL